MATETSDYATFRAAWLEPIEAAPTTVQKGNGFAHKILSQWLDTDDDSLEIVYCDGSGDGGIDAAVLERGDGGPDGGAGDTWYLVQSKYGSAFAGEATLLAEGIKVIDTLDGERKTLSSLASGLQEKLTVFRKQAGEQDRICLLFATVDPLTDSETNRLSDLASMGKARLGSLFDVQAISLRTIHDALVEEETLAAERRLTVPLTGHLAEAADDLLVGSVPLTQLYGFLKEYRGRTGNNLDQIYEKNVRKFLGGKAKVNLGMRRTLREEPERFGLFNNGITIVVSDFRAEGSGTYALVEPFVVNGCQTTRTIFDVCSTMLDAGGSGASDEVEAWRKRADRGCVVTKVAKVGHDGERLLQDITRYTNSQNAVRDKDFIALDTGFKAWQKAMAEKYGIYLEIQRGGWDSQRAFQKQNPTTQQFTLHANALDLVKAYGAGWHAEPGLAYGKNPPFLPGGSVFSKLTADGTVFGADSLHAAYLLVQAGESNAFGRGGPLARRQTKFLFYFVVIHLLRDVLSFHGLAHDATAVTLAVNRLLAGITDGGRELIENAVNLIDTYMNQEDEAGFSKEPLLSQLNLDVNAFLKSEALGRTLEKTPNLTQALFSQKQFMKKKMRGMPSAYEVIHGDLADPDLAT